uniref:Histone acetyltransferase n=1 Tax=Timema cristinae TaxID=61476 RepID=A0A7R9CAM2_TIMCR|nr:unnamed protein product [Timema cristinae]
MRDQEGGGQTSSWSTWILDAIRKIRAQKQRPSVERICHAVRQHHKDLNPHEDEIKEHLEATVKEGIVLKVFNKGQSTYKDPGGVQSRQLELSKGADLSKVIVKAARELGERDGSTLKSIEKYIRQSHALNVSADVDFRSLLRISAKRAEARGYLVHDGRLYKPTGRPIVGSAPTTPKRQSVQVKTAQTARRHSEQTKSRKSSESQISSPEIPKQTYIWQHCSGHLKGPPSTYNPPFRRVYDPVTSTRIIVTVQYRTKVSIDRALLGIVDD